MHSVRKQNNDSHHYNQIELLNVKKKYLPIRLPLRHVSTLIRTLARGLITQISPCLGALNTIGGRIGGLWICAINVSKRLLQNTAQVVEFALDITRRSVLLVNNFRGFLS